MSTSRDLTYSRLPESTMTIPFLFDNDIVLTYSRLSIIPTL